MGLRKRLAALSEAFAFIDRKTNLLQAGILELGNELLAALGRCRNADVVGPCGCASCTTARDRIRLYADAMAALQAEENALADKLPAGVVRATNGDRKG